MASALVQKRDCKYWTRKIFKMAKIKKVKKDQIFELIKEKISSGSSYQAIGIEKESLRYNPNEHEISYTNHPKSLGASLTNKFITTDFSECQLEMITPPNDHSSMALEFLDDLHRFVSKNIGKEIIWPISIPPNTADDIKIPIANYGKSNLAKFKESYRNGLSMRYGRSMQLISGIHYNFSLSEGILQKIYISDENHKNQSVSSDIYFRIIRNMNRMNWLILYLFGASPTLSKQLIGNKIKKFSTSSKNTYFLPNATSLRMSEYGYRSKVQSKIKIPLNSLDSYIDGLKVATETPYSIYDFHKQGLEKNFQLNSNLLQIEDEFYGTARAKSNLNTNVRTISKLLDSGVNFIELRSIDLDPFSSIGISQTTCNFLDLYFLFCLYEDSSLINSDEEEIILFNDLTVAKEGRKPGLMLKDKNGRISLKDWGNIILDKMAKLFSSKIDNLSFANVTIEEMRARVNDPHQTLSGKFLNQILENKYEVEEFAEQISKKYNQHYLNSEIKNPKNSNMIHQEVSSSFENKSDLEENDALDFDDFLNGYFRL